jgi:general secretion pathway protein C
MGSVLTSTANVALFVLGCFLAADTGNEVIGALLLAPTQQAVAPAGAAPAASQRTWAERQVILSRNLFNSSTRAPLASSEPAPEDVEKSRLPVQLMGTFASSDDAISRATLLDKEKNETLVVGIGDQIKGKALVTRIERRRVLLTENGAPRELTLEEEQPGTPSVARRSRTPERTARNPRQRVRRNGNGDFDVSRAEVEETLRNPTQLLSQARVLPKF